jgi:hypothetical protein
LQQHTDMHTRTLALWALLSSSVAFAGPHLELEVGAGASGLVDPAAFFTHPSATFSGRVGLDLFEFFTPSVRVLVATPLSLDPAGWAFLGELRLHTPGVFQLTGGVAFGLSSAGMAFRAATTSLAALAPYLTADLGVRVKLGPVLIGIGVGGAPWISPQWTALANVGVSLFD